MDESNFYPPVRVKSGQQQKVKKRPQLEQESQQKHQVDVLHEARQEAGLVEMSPLPKAPPHPSQPLPTLLHRITFPFLPAPSLLPTPFFPTPLRPTATPIKKKKKNNSIPKGQSHVRETGWSWNRTFLPKKEHFYGHYLKFSP